MTLCYTNPICMLFVPSVICLSLPRTSEDLLSRPMSPETFQSVKVYLTRFSTSDFDERRAERS
jgi:hypothetical protein